MEEGEEEPTEEEDVEIEGEEEIDIGKEAWVRKGDKEIIDIFHTQSKNAREKLVKKIKEFDAWILDREGLTDLPNVRMAIDIHQQIADAMTCLIKEIRILLKIKNESISFMKNEIEKQETKYNNKIKKLEERIEKLNEKKEMKLKTQQIKICERIKAGAKIPDLAKEEKLSEKTIRRYWKAYKEGQNVYLTEKPQQNISKIEKT